MAYAGGAAAAAAAAAIARATKASGAIVNMEADGFQAILARSERPLVVVASGGFFSRSFSYLTPYKGLIFYTKSSTELMLPSRAEVVAAKSIWVPS
jgi:hypothetical protein